jgi:hypothetical protein
MATLSLRRPWVIYKRTAMKEGLSPRERLRTQLAFYSGARGVLRVLAYLMEHGDYEELHATIRRHARQIEKIRQRPSRRRH